MQRRTGQHHLARMYDMHVNVAYLPQGRVLGLSKIARICDMAAKRLQLQERLGSDIAAIISEAAGTPDVGVVISGCHSCMSARCGRCHQRLSQLHVGARHPQHLGKHRHHDL